MVKKDSRLINSRNPLSYLGNNAYSPPNIVEFDRAPTVGDNKNVFIGDMWINNASSPINLYVLVSLAAGTATWLELTTGVTPPWTVPQGGTGQVSLTDHGLLLGSGTGAITPLAEASNGQIPIGSTGNNPSLATLTAGAGIGIVNAAGSITISSTAATPPWTVPQGGTGQVSLTDHGLLLGSGTGAITPLAEASNGQIPIGSTGNAPTLATLTAGAGIGIANAAGSITISNTGGGSGSSTCSFLAYQPSSVNVGGSGSSTYLGKLVTLTEVFDVGGDFYPGDGAGTEAEFVAPQTGKYLITSNIWWETQSIGSGVGTVLYNNIQTSSREFWSISAIYPSGTVRYDHSLKNVSTIDLTAGDSVTIYCQAVGAGINYMNGDATDAYTWVSGTLL